MMANRRYFLLPFVAILLSIVFATVCLKYVVLLVGWEVAQWLIPFPSIRARLEQAFWEHCEADIDYQRDEAFLSIPIVDVQEHPSDILSYLEIKYGKDWRKRPLLLKNLWTTEALSNTSRRLSLQGLLQENLTVPYFTDARINGALSPDGKAPVKDIVERIQQGAAHKIGSQLVVERYPDLVNEVATEILTELFGNYFTPYEVQRRPALTTVPIFIASGKSSASLPQNPIGQRQPFTALHCEPIGNVAVQLSGEKKWTLVNAQHWRQLRPSVSPDQRAFFASWAANHRHVPTYTAITSAGDALWVPTWTWHRVDYVDSKDMAIGASLFHFRVVDFFSNNPIFAFLIFPALLMELVGYNTQ